MKQTHIWCQRQLYNLGIQEVISKFTKLRHEIRIRKKNKRNIKPEITVIMETVNIEARTFEEMLSTFQMFADRLDTFCQLYGDIKEKMAG